MNQRAVMHLARAFNLIEGCKDAIWEEYEDLERIAEKERARAAREKGKERQHDVESPQATSARSKFDKSWMNWEKYVSP